MKEEEEKHIDRKFRDGLLNPEEHIAYNDADWDSMEQLLDERKNRRGFVFRLPFILAAAAAILLLVLGFFFLYPEEGKQKDNNVVKANTKATGNIKTDMDTVHKEIPQLKLSAKNAVRPPLAQGKRNRIYTPNNIQESLQATDLFKKQTKINSRNSVGRPLNEDNVIVLSPTAIFGDNSETIAFAETDSNKIKAQSQQILAAVNNAQHMTVQGADTPAAAVAVPLVKQKNKPLVEITGVKHPIVLSIIAAPDINGVGNAFNRAQVGTNAGLMLSVGITRKLTISTGAVYARKPYLVGMDEYKTNYKFRVQPDNVSADCRVLDIPLNIDYQVYNKGRNLFSVGTGLSSYFMLRENYHFNHSGYYTGPSDYNIKNKNQHIMGVVNINATYQRRINSNFGLNVQPYMKLPITNIGYGQVNLRSAGLAIGASWYLNTSASKK